MADVVVGYNSNKNGDLLKNNKYRLLLLSILIIISILLMYRITVFFLNKDQHKSKSYRTDMSYSELSNQINSYVIKKNYDDAIFLIKSQKKIDANSKDQLLASVYTNDNKSKKAIEYYAQLLKSQRMTQGDAYSAATLAYKNNDISSAKKFLDRARQLAINNTTDPVSKAEADRYKQLIDKINKGESVKL